MSGEQAKYMTSHYQKQSLKNKPAPNRGLPICRAFLGRHQVGRCSWAGFPLFPLVSSASALRLASGRCLWARAPGAQLMGRGLPRLRVSAGAEALRPARSEWPPVPSCWAGGCCRGWGSVSGPGADPRQGCRRRGGACGCRGSPRVSVALSPSLQTAGH